MLEILKTSYALFQAYLNLALTILDIMKAQLPSLMTHMKKLGFWHNILIIFEVIKRGHKILSCITDNPNQH